MLNEPIRALSFDAAGTLIHLKEPVGQSYARVAMQFGAEAKPDDLSEAFKRVWKRTPAPFSPESRIDDPSEQAWWRRLVRDVFSEACVEFPDKDTFDAFFEALYEHFESPGTWEADPSAHQVLQAASPHFRLVILSNFDDRLHRILQDLGLYHHFESLILSGELGASKPDPRIFREVAQILELSPESILHIGDDPECDWKGAEEAGFRHFRVGKGEKTLGELLGELSLA